jgi:protein TonB
MSNVHPTIKFFVIGTGALVATSLCFYLMLFLITNEIPPTVELSTPPFFSPNIAEPLKEKPVAQREKPQKVLPLQPPSDPDATVFSRASRVELKAEKPTFGSIADLLGPTDIRLELDAPHSELTPLYVVQPFYPLRAAMREVEGFVIVEFSVRENGTVANPVVVASQPDVLFDEAALNAVSRFRFKPREIGGDKVRVDNVKLRFAFNLESFYPVEEE